MPLLINTGIVKAGASTAVDRLLLNIRRGSVALILFASYFYFQNVIGTQALVSIGLVSFLAVAQFAPALLGGIYWKNGTRLGALTGIIVGCSVWAYTLPFSQLIDTGLFSKSIMTEGLFNISWLRPHQLFGLETMTPVAQATFWSLILNISCYFGVSLFTRQNALERGQANLFVDESRYSTDLQRQYLWRGTATSEELRDLLQRFLGAQRTNRVLKDFARQKGLNPAKVWQADAELVHYAETLLSGAIGSVSARIMISSVVKEEPLNMEEVMEMLDATQQVIAYSQQLEEKSKQLEKASSELSEANRRLKELDELKDEFIATITHELRTPLTSIRAFSEIIHDSVELNDEQRKEFLAIIIKESERLTRMINQILDSEKLASGRMEWHMDQVDLKGIVEETLSSMSQLMRDKKIKVKIKLEEISMPVYGDHDRLTQVLMNLLGNAIKFCPEQNGLIRIKLKKLKNQLELRIEDNGIGIQADDQARIFDKFQQLTPKDGKPSGTGLGLSISKSIIEHHQGSIGLAADSENGAVFCITLPLK
jgi:signal transduction histidine kinase